MLKNTELTSGALFTAALAISLGGAYLLPDTTAYLFVSALQVLLLGIFSLIRPSASNLSRCFVAALLLAGPVALSLGVNGGALDRFALPLALAIFCLVAYVAGARLTEEGLSRSVHHATIVALGLAAMAILIYHWDIVGALRSGARVMAGGMNWSMFGLIALAIFTLAAASDNIVFVFVIAMPCIVLCQAAGSRSAMLALMATLATSGAMWLNRQYKSKRITTASLTVLVPAALIVLTLIAPLLISVVGHAFLIDDQYRGGATGFSGRKAIWSYFWNSWLEKPVFGLGPGTYYVVGGTLLYAHNMVLEILSDSGLIGLLAFAVWLIWVGSCGQDLRHIPTLRRLSAVCIVCYLVYGIFEGRAVNIGNPLSALFFLAGLAALGASKRSKVRRQKPVVIAPARHGIMLMSHPHRLRQRQSSHS